MSKRRVLTGFVVAAAAAALMQACARADEGAAKAAVGKPAPDFKLPDIYGHDFSLSQFKGKIVVVEWMSQNCPVSRGKAGVMAETYKKYADKDVVWLGIDSSSKSRRAYADPDQQRVYAAKMGLAYPILMDPDGKVGRSYGAKTTPHMFVIDREGKLRYEGAIDDKGDTNYVAAALDAVINGSTVAVPKSTPYGCSVKYAAK